MDVAKKSSAHTVQRAWLVDGREEDESSARVCCSIELPEAVMRLNLLLPARKMGPAWLYLVPDRWARRIRQKSRQAVWLSHKTHGQILGNFEDFLFIHAVFGKPARWERTVGA